MCASEDSLQEVMEGYESPQKLFQDLGKEKDEQKSKNTKKMNSPPSQDNQIQKANSTKSIQGDNERDKPLPRWLYSTAIVESLFVDGSFKRGFGTLLKNGFYLTSSEVVYNAKVMPKKIIVKMQDDLSANMMCVSQLSIKALDLDSGLALLKVSKMTDSYCQVRAKSYYQDRIFKHFGINVFASHASVAPHTLALFPTLNDDFLFTFQSLRLEKAATYYDFDSRRERIYGFELQHKYEEPIYGRAFYDDKGVFLGITSRAGVSYLPVFINRNVIQDFLCDMQDKGIIDDSNIYHACKNLGKNRERFFTDMKGMSNFY